jgi:molybdate transport system substrate-binding protein
VNPKYFLPILALLAIAPVHAQEADVIVMISGGFKSTYEALAPAFEQKTGSRLITVPGPSEGVTYDTIPNRVARGEPDDVLVMVGTALDALVKKGETVPGSEVNVALSPIGMAVRAGTPLPDISTVPKFRQVLLDSRSVAYSDSASGVYIQATLFKKLGIEQQMRGKAHEIQATPVGEIVAHGQAEIGFQEVAELLPVKGITFVGRLPREVELLTRYSAAVARRSRHPDRAWQLVQYISSPDIQPTLEKMGLEPPQR